MFPPSNTALKTEHGARTLSKPPERHASKFLVLSAQKKRKNVNKNRSSRALQFLIYLVSIEFINNIVYEIIFIFANRFLNMFTRLFIRKLDGVGVTYLTTMRRN